ncbi:MAG: hypothetical protein J5835_03415 [Bacteroidales bacterium]|nr:hypothetical protein [Bacteroidales bacterium]
MTRRIASVLLVLLIGTSLHAQKVRGIFSLADRITSNSYLGHAGRQYLKPVPPKETTFAPAAFNPSESALDIDGDGDFILDLLSRSLVTDALVLLGEGNYRPSDALSYYRGLALFDDRQFQGSDIWLSKAGGRFSEPALFYGNVAKIHLDRPLDAISALGGYNGPNAEMASLQRAGLALIGGNEPLFREESSHFTYSDYRLSESEKALMDLSSVFEKRPGSPALAAVMSAILPGSGKVYAGKTGQGVASFLAVGSLAAITAEQWSHNGPYNWRTVLAGSLCAVLYIGNIYGSWLSVSIHQQEVNDETKALVIYNLTVPLHGFFR